MKPQTRQVLDVLRQRGSISDLEAYEDLSIRRLAARVYELRHDYGLEIESIPERHSGGRHARYFIRQTELAL